MNEWMDVMAEFVPKHLYWQETMSGTHRPVAGARAGRELPFSFTVDCKSTPIPSVFNYFDPENFLVFEATGTVHAADIAEDRPLKGRITLRYVKEQKLHYYFEFIGDDGKDYYFKGEKRDIWPWNFWKTHFELFGAIYEKDTGAMLSEATLYFAYSDLPAMFRSMRLGN